MASTVPLQSPALSPLSLPTTNNCFLSPEHYHLSLSSSPYGSSAIHTDYAPSFDFQTSLKASRFQNINTGSARLHYGGFMTEEVKSRPRNMSLSPTDRELSSDVKPPRRGSIVDLDPDDRGNPLKRKFSTDTIDYPRRRATIACEICRSRKSRCDGARPKCRLCTELNADCVYREPGIKLDAGDKLILGHLEDIKHMIEQAGLLVNTNGGPINGPRIEGSVGGASVGGGGMSAEGLSGNGMNNGSSNGFATTIDSPAPTSSTVQEDATGTAGLGGGLPHAKGFGSWFNPMADSTMPKNHTTPALNLLHWPKIRDLVSQRWDPQVLVQLETHREPLFFGQPRILDFSNAHMFAEAYFKRVNVWYACVSPYSWNRYYHKAQTQGFREGAESCMALLVLALGCASTTGSISQLPPKTELPGYPYFMAAWAILPSLMLRTDILAAQCQILAAAYLFYAVRPLEAWNVLSGTSMKLQLLLNGTLPAGSKQLSERVFWNALLFESDLLAELELPHSGIVQFEDFVGLPTPFEDMGEDRAGVDDLRYFNAEIALRRLLNRVSNTIYSKASPIKSTAALDPVVTDLDGQLIEWYNGLPPALQFDYGRAPLASPVQNVLRLRYFACRTIIYRPYVLAVLIKETAFLDPAVQENCRKCLEACIRQLENITAHHAGHLPYLWQGALSIVSQTLLVMGATLSPSLAGLLPQPHQVNAIIEEVVREVKRFSHLAPSLGLAASIIADAEDRRRQNLRSPSMQYLKVA